MSSITVYPYLSPRIVEVLDPATDITVQEIVNLVRDWEDDEANMAYNPLIDAAGKESLGGGVLVGITATLQNAQLRFSSRPDELETGTVTTGSSGGITLHDTSGQFETNGVYSGCTVVNNTTTAMETVTNVVSEIELELFALGGGTRNDWQVGDSYSIYPNVQCAITGGNLVAIDSVSAEISPILQSPNVQIIRSSSSSATLQELGAIQYASFNGGVTVNTSTSYTGTAFPVGTPQEPVNNLADAMLIVSERGFTTIYIVGDMTVDSSGNYSGMTFIGESMSKSTLTISAGADVENCEFYEATIDGTLDGNAKLKNCRLLSLDYIYGVVEQCMIGPGTIVLGGTEEAHFLDCWSGVAGAATPVIDCGGGGQNLALRNYNGGIKLINKTGTDKVSIDLNSGQVILDSTVTNGEIVIRGIGKLIDNSTGTTSVDDTHLLRTENIADAIWNEDMSDHLSPGTTGKRLYDGGTGGGLTSDETAAAVWNALKDDYGTPGTMGWLQKALEIGIISMPKILPGE